MGALMLGSHRRWSRRAAPGCPPCNASQHWARRLDEPGFTNRRALPVQANAYMRATQAATAPQNRALRTTRRSKHNHLHLFLGFWRHQAPVPTGRTCRSRINRHSRGGRSAYLWSVATAVLARRRQRGYREGPDESGGSFTLDLIDPRMGDPVDRDASTLQCGRRPTCPGNRLSAAFFNIDCRGGVAAVRKSVERRSHRRTGTRLAPLHARLHAIRFR